MIAFLLSPIGRLVMAGIAGAAIGFSGAWTVQGWRLDAAKAAHEVFVAKVEALGEQAKADKLKKEQEHEKVLMDVSKAWQGSLDAAVSGAVKRYRVRNPSPGGGPLPSIAGNPQAPDGSVTNSVACAPDEAFIKECAAGAVMIDSYQTWARGIGFPVK